MTTITPILRASETTLVEMDAGVSPASIPHSTPHTIAIITDLRDTVANSNKAELPAVAEIGDLIEVYSVRSGGSNGEVTISAASGDDLGVGVSTVGCREALFRKVSATGWRVLASK